MRVLRLLELVVVVAVLALVSGVLPKAQETDAAGRDLFCGPLNARDVDGQVVDLTVANNSEKDGDVTLRIFRGNDNNVEEADFDLGDDGDAASITDDVGETGLYYGRIGSNVTVSGALSVRQGDITLASVPCYTKGETGEITCGELPAGLRQDTGADAIRFDFVVAVA